MDRRFKCEWKEDRNLDSSLWDFSGDECVANIYSKTYAERAGLFV